VGKLFGTDGVRGVANAELTPELALRLGRALLGVLDERPESGWHGTGRPLVVVGRDPRASGSMLEGALLAGICAAGGDALLAGVLPTPAVAFLTQHYRAAAGAVISASHNPMADNGIKFFGPAGFKFPDAIEDRIEAALGLPDQGAPRPVGAAIGRVVDAAHLPLPAAAAAGEGGDAAPDGRGTSLHPISAADAAAEAYLEHLLEGVPDLGGLRMVVDCAHGAASAVAPAAYRRAGADALAIGCEPDGENINENAGSTHPERLQQEVVRSGAALGLAHDGDADRLVAVDERGGLVDGDAILAITALDAHRRGELPTGTVVTTVMTNLGFRRAMAANGIEVVQTKVGDRHVLEAMRAGGHTIGGEQSGHLIFLDRATTGDGVLTGLRLLGVVARSGQPLSALASVMERLPQTLVNVRVADRDGLEPSEAVKAAVDAASERLGERGRVLVRASGTEPVVRVMVEAETLVEAESITETLVKVVLTELG
jgi:phosphoglucosamine mutase